MRCFRFHKAMRFTSALALGLILILGCFGGQVAQAASSGDLVINEIMQNPAAVADAAGEWFELFADDIIDEIKSWDEIQQVVPGDDWSTPKYLPTQNQEAALVVRSVGSWDGTFLPDYSDSECQLLSQMGVSYRRHKSDTRRFGLYVRGALCGLALAILGTLQLFVDIGINHDETFIYRATALVAIMWVCDLIVWALLIYPRFYPYWYQQIEAYHRHWRQMRESL